MQTDLPGKQIDNNVPILVQPGAGTPASQPTQEDVARWNQLASIRPALAELMAVFDRHPELAAWARGSQAGTIRLSP